MTITDKKLLINAQIKKFKELFDQGGFKDYVDLYKVLVGIPLEKKASSLGGYEFAEVEKEELSNYRRDLYRFIGHLETLKTSFYATKIEGYRFFLNRDCSWTYAELEFGVKRPLYREMIKLYAPVKNSELSREAGRIFDYLYQKNKAFCFKIAHLDRRDNICIWILKEDFAKTIEFLATIFEGLLPSPLFCPEYKGIGVSRELMDSYNAVIASTLYCYLMQAKQLTLEEYFQSLENNWSESLYDFDKEIVRRSLSCILNELCPLTDPNFSVVEFVCDSY